MSSRRHRVVGIRSLRPAHPRCIGTSLLTRTAQLDFEVPRGVAAVSPEVVSFRDRTPTAMEDELAVEEPLEIRLGARAWP